MSKISNIVVIHPSKDHCARLISDFFKKSGNEIVLECYTSMRDGIKHLENSSPNILFISLELKRSAILNFYANRF